MRKNVMVVVECDACGYKEIRELPVILTNDECPRCSATDLYVVGIEEEEEIIEEIYKTLVPDLFELAKKWEKIGKRKERL